MLHKFYKSTDGVTSIEYGLVALAMAVLIVAVLLGDDAFLKALTEKYSVLTSGVSSAVVSKD